MRLAMPVTAVALAVASMAWPAAAASTTQQATGIDVSSAQHPGGAAINWPQVAAAGYTFAFVKVTEGSYYVNPHYASDAAAARAAGLITAAYHFAIPNDSSGTLQADLALDAAGSAPDGRTLPLILDIEYDPYNNLDHTNWCYGLTPAAMVAWLSAFTGEVQRRTGGLPVIYTTAQWWNKCTGRSKAFGADPLWIASRSTSPVLPVGWKHWTYWQFTSTATVPGISVPTDVSYLSATSLAAAIPATQSDQAGGTVTLAVRSLNAAAGETLTWSAAGLPPGLTIDPASGVISGTLPAAPARYRVSVTVTDASADSATVPFTWLVHGSASLTSPGDQASIAGHAVSLQVKSADGLTGCSLTFTASGLPPGLAISPCGRITGWPSRPGGSQVTVRASDSAGSVLASTTFGWTVAPAAVVTAGQIGSDVAGTCLTGPAATGQPAQLWACGKSPGQHWELTGNDTLRLDGKCLGAVAVSAGTTVPELRACTSSQAQLWQQAAGGALVSAQTRQCLTDPAAASANGTALTLAACAGDPGQAWTLPAGPLAPDMPGRCLAGTAASGHEPTAVSLASCGTAASQHWSLHPDGSVTVDGACLAAGQPAPGSAVTVAPCAGTPAQQWQPLPESGGTFMVNQASGLCLDAGPASRTPLVLGFCLTGFPHLAWHTG